jgi:hypothetical protein
MHEHECSLSLNPFPLQYISYPFELCTLSVLCATISSYYALCLLLSSILLYYLLFYKFYNFT